MKDFCEDCGAVYEVCTTIERFRGLCYRCFEKRAKEEERAEEIEFCKCGHPRDEHHKGFAVGLETFHCECGKCPEYDAAKRTVDEKEDIKALWNNKWRNQDND